MHDFVEKQRCVYRFGCRNVACAAWHTLAEQEHKRTKQKLRQREWEAECGFCSVGACRYGPMCQREKAVADDSGYEDEADGWSVVGRGRARSVRLESRAEASGHGGRFAALSVVEIADMEEQKKKCYSEVFFECDCDDSEFIFELRNERRIRQQERRKQEGQQRKGRTARKRVKAANETVVRNVVMRNHTAQKRQSWLIAKLLRTVTLWRAAIAEAKACYVYQDDWRQLEDQMRQHLHQDERFWKGAVNDLRSSGVMVCPGEKERLSDSVAQVELFRKIAVDGKSSRFEQYAEKCDAGTGPTSRSRGALQDGQQDQQRRRERHSAEKARLEATDRLRAHLVEKCKTRCADY
jgi:hypothetical protein